MLRGSLETLVSGILIFLAGYLIWPPRDVYWVAISDKLGESLTILIVVGICIGFGIVVRGTTPITSIHFAIGGLIAYFIGMSLIEGAIDPISPVHFYGYGLMLLFMMFGHNTRKIIDLFLDFFKERTNRLVDR